MNSFFIALLSATAFIAQVLGASVATRGDPVLTCGNLATADKRDVMDLLFNFKKKEKSTKCGAKAKSCSRVSCFNTSALYICNTSDKDMEMNCYEAANLIDKAGGCCPKSYTQSNGVSGTLRTQEGWEFSIGYANCNHSPDTNPSVYKGSNNSNCES